MKTTNVQDLLDGKIDRINGIDKASGKRREIVRRPDYPVKGKSEYIMWGREGSRLTLWNITREEALDLLNGNEIEWEYEMPEEKKLNPTEMLLSERARVLAKRYQYPSEEKPKYAVLIETPYGKTVVIDKGEEIVSSFWDKNYRFEFFPAKSEKLERALEGFEVEEWNDWA